LLMERSDLDRETTITTFLNLWPFCGRFHKTFFRVIYAPSRIASVKTYGYTLIHA
jgi:hypothetical protein